MQARAPVLGRLTHTRLAIRRHGPAPCRLLHGASRRPHREQGATEIIEHVEPVEKSETIATPSDTHRRLAERDWYEHGNGGYTGSWAEVLLIQPAERAPQRRICREARRFAHEALAGDTGPRKWDAGHYVPVYAAEPGSGRELRITLDAEQRLAYASTGLTATCRRRRRLPRPTPR